MAFSKMDDGRLSVGKALKTTSVLGQFRDNDLANSDKSFPLEVNFNGSPATTYPGTAQVVREHYLPEDAERLDVALAGWCASGTVTWKVRVERRSAPSGFVEAETSSSETSKTTAAEKTVTLSGLANVSGDDLRGQEVKVHVFLKHSAGGVVCDLESIDVPGTRSYTS